MSDRIGYNHAQIAALTGDVLGSAQSLQSRLDDLKAYIAPLVAEWQGEAAQQYGQHQAEWNRAADSLQNMLRAVASAAGRGNDAMQAADRAAAGAW